MKKKTLLWGIIIVTVVIFWKPISASLTKLKNSIAKKTDGTANPPSASA